MAIKKSASEMLEISKRALASAKRNKRGNTEVKRIKKLVTKYKKLSPEAMKMYKEAARGIKKVPKASIAKRVLGKTLSKAIPGVGAAIIARDVVKGISKATCSKRGGKWVSGKCQGARKTKLKAGSKVRDPISKR
jgi:hypothetical protein